MSINLILGTFFNVSAPAQRVSAPIKNTQQKTAATNSISSRNNYLKITKNANYKVKSGDSLDKIAKSYNIETRSLMVANNLNEKSVLNVGQVLKIPDTVVAKNINSLNNIASCLNVSPAFIKGLKKMEDGDLKENQFHNNIYTDKAGVSTIGIGHRYKNGEPKSLTNKQVLELCANDLLKMEANIKALIGAQNYQKLPSSIKEALLDMVFNKGTAILTEDPNLLYRLKLGKYESVINCFTNNRSAKTKKEMSGLSKRRLYDISLAIKVYNGRVPQSNINTAQNVYNRGIQLLRQECKIQKLNFQYQLNAYNRDVKSYLGTKIKYINQ